MRILVACEYSGRVRDAFRSLGHDAVSCDLLPSESPGPHIQGDAIEAIQTELGNFDGSLERSEVLRKELKRLKKRRNQKIIMLAIE